MSLRRKVLRALLNKHPHCCGERMLTKSDGETDTEILYVCLNCGKEKWVKKVKVRREENEG